MKIYTRTGDDGSTGLFGGGRIRKSDPRIECYGTIDELNAAIGLAAAAVEASAKADPTADAGRIGAVGSASADALSCLILARTWGRRGRARRRRSCRRWMR